jgi:hypothetical protein
MIYLETPGNVFRILLFTPAMEESNRKDTVPTTIPEVEKVVSKQKRASYASRELDADDDDDDDNGDDDDFHLHASRDNVAKATKRKRSISIGQQAVAPRGTPKDSLSDSGLPRKAVTPVHQQHVTKVHQQQGERLHHSAHSAQASVHTGAAVPPSRGPQPSSRPPQETSRSDWRRMGAERGLLISLIKMAIDDHEGVSIYLHTK